MTDQAVRELSISDVDRLVAIDRQHTGHSRRHYFEKRFSAAAADPEGVIHLGLHRGGALRGFALARVLRGEFGRDEAVAVLDALGVEPESEQRGVGHALISELTAVMRRRGVTSLQTEANWTDHALLRFFEAEGFQLAPRMVLERAIAPLDESTEEV